MVVKLDGPTPSPDSLLWFKSKPPTPDTDEDVYSQKPATYKSRTGPDAKVQSGREWGARVGANIGKLAGALLSPLRRAQTDANNSKTYKCRQCGASFRVGNLKRDIVIHIRRPANKKYRSLRGILANILQPLSESLRFYIYIYIHIHSRAAGTL